MPNFITSDANNDIGISMKWNMYKRYFFKEDPEIESYTIWSVLREDLDNNHESFFRWLHSSNEITEEKACELGYDRNGSTKQTIKNESKKLLFFVCQYIKKKNDVYEEWDASYHRVLNGNQKQWFLERKPDEITKSEADNLLEKAERLGLDVSANEDGDIMVYEYISNIHVLRKSDNG